MHLITVAILYASLLTLCGAVCDCVIIACASLILLQVPADKAQLEPRQTYIITCIGGRCSDNISRPTSEPPKPTSSKVTTTTKVTTTSKKPEPTPTPSKVSAPSVYLYDSNHFLLSAIRAVANEFLTDYNQNKHKDCSPTNQDYYRGGRPE